MSENELVFLISFGVAFLFAVLVIVVGFSKRPTRKERFVEKASAQGCCVEATLVSYHRGHSRNNSNEFYHCDYEYKVDGKLYEKYTQTPYMSFAQDKTPPLKQVLYYDVNNPQKAIFAKDVTSKKYRKSGSLYFALVSFVFVFLILKLLLPAWI